MDASTPYRFEYAPPEQERIDIPVRLLHISFALGLGEKKPQRACAGGLRYLSFVCVGVCLSVGLSVTSPASTSLIPQNEICRGLS